MDFVKNLTSGNNGNPSSNNPNQASIPTGEMPQQKTGGAAGAGGFLGGLGNKLNTAAGGGVESEKREDYLDKGENAFSVSCLSLRKPL